MSLTKQKILISTAIFLVHFSIAAYMARFGVDPHHDGIMLKPAIDVLNGLVLYKESFSQYNILTTHLQAWTMQIFGENLYIVKLSTAFFYALSGVTLFLIWSSFLPIIISGIVAFLWILIAPFYIWVMIPWSSVYALTFQLLAFLFFISAIRTKNYNWFIAIGALSALSAWCRQTVGTLELIAFIICLIYMIIFYKFLNLEIKFILKSALNLVIGFFSISLIVIGQMYINHSLLDWNLQTIQMASRFASEIGESWGGHQSPFIPILKALFSREWGYIWIIFPVCAILVTVSLLVNNILRKTLSETNLILLCFSIVTMASWHQYYPVTCYRHVFWSTSMYLGVIAYLAYRGFSLLQSKSRIFYPVLFTLVFIFGFLYKDIVFRYSSAMDRINENSNEMRYPPILQNLRVTQEEKDVYAEMGHIISTIQEKYPEQDLITTGYDALYLTFWKNKKNFHPLYVNFDIGVYVYPKFPIALADYIKTKKPIIVSLGDVDYNLGYKTFADFKNGMSITAPYEVEIPQDTHTHMMFPQREGANEIVDHIGFTNFYDGNIQMKVLDGFRVSPLPLNDNATIELMVYPEKVQNSGAVILSTSYMNQKNGYVIRRKVLSENPSNEYEFLIGDGERLNPVLSFTLIPQNQNYLAITRKQNEWHAYVNGILQSSGSEIHLLNSHMQTSVCYWKTRLNNFNGRVDEIRLLNVADTDKDIQKTFERIVYREKL